jgi:hypothetical protein
MQLHEYSEYRLARDVQFELHLQAKPGRCKDEVTGTCVILTSHADCIGLCMQPNIILDFLFLRPLNKQLYQTLSSMKYGSTHHPSSPYLGAASARTSSCSLPATTSDPTLAVGNLADDLTTGRPPLLLLPHPSLIPIR